MLISTEGRVISKLIGTHSSTKKPVLGKFVASEKTIHVKKHHEKFPQQTFCSVKKAGAPLPTATACSKPKENKQTSSTIAGVTQDRKKQTSHKIKQLLSHSLKQLKAKKVKEAHSIQQKQLLKKNKEHSMRVLNDIVRIKNSKKFKQTQFKPLAPWGVDERKVRGEDELKLQQFIDQERLQTQTCRTYSAERKSTQKLFFKGKKTKRTSNKPPSTAKKAKREHRKQTKHTMKTAQPVFQFEEFCSGDSPPNEQAALFRVRSSEEQSADEEVRRITGTFSSSEEESPLGLFIN